MQIATVLPSKDFEMSMGQMLKSAREQAAVSQRDLSARTGISLPSIRKYERAGEDSGQYPPTDKLFAICKVLGVDPGTLMAEVSGDEKSALAQVEDAGELDTLRQQVTGMARTLERLAQQKPTNENAVLDDGADPVEELAAYVLAHGLTGRKIVQRLEAAEAALADMEYSQLLALALEQALDISECPDAEVVADGGLGAVEQECSMIATRLIFGALYPDLRLDDISYDGMALLVEDIDQALSPGAFVADAVGGRSLLPYESADDAQQRWRSVLPGVLVDAVKSGARFKIEDDQRYFDSE